MKLKPWYDVVKPREDLREGKPLDAAEFAVHLDKVRLGTAPQDYKDPVRFFEAAPLTGTEAAWIRLRGAEALRTAWREAGIDPRDPQRSAAAL